VRSPGQKLLPWPGEVFAHRLSTACLSREDTLNLRRPAIDTRLFVHAFTAPRSGVRCPHLSLLTVPLGCVGHPVPRWRPPSASSLPVVAAIHGSHHASEERTLAEASLKRLRNGGEPVTDTRPRKKSRGRTSKRKDTQHLAALHELRSEFIGAVRRGALDKTDPASHHDFVRILSSNSSLTKRLHRVLGDAGVKTALKGKATADILGLCGEALFQFEDPVTQLTFPAPPPSLPYARNPGKLDIPRFVKAEWPAYLAKGVLFLEDIFRCDFTLWRACRYQAQQAGVPVYNYAKSIGILSKPVMQANPKDYARQLVLFKAIDATVRAGAFIRSRQELIERAADSEAFASEPELVGESL
jgi:hypothetical protein